MPRRRRNDDFLPEVPDDVLGTGAGTDRIAFDQTTAPAEEPPMAAPLGEEALAQSPEDALPPEPGLEGGEMAPPPDAMLAGLGGGMPPEDPGTGDMSNVDLAGMQVGGGEELGLEDPEEAAIAEMSAALENPATDPNTRAMIQQQLELAARRRLVGGGAGLGV